MFNVVLFEPKIPPNTGNIIRLCSNTNCSLHVIRPLGFIWDDRRLKRAGLDYSEFVNVKFYYSYQEFRKQNDKRRVLAITKFGNRSIHHMKYESQDFLLFGCETKGLPDWLLETIPKEHRLRIPMAANTRCLNLSNAVAVVVYTAYSICNYQGLS